MQSDALVVTKGCWGSRKAKRFLVLRNFELLSFVAEEDKEAEQALDLRACDAVSGHEGERMLEIVTASTTVTFQVKELNTYNAWANVLRAFSGRTKVWHPLTMPLVFYQGLHACLDYLQAHGTRTEGIFRISADERAVRAELMSIFAGGRWKEGNKGEREREATADDDTVAKEENEVTITTSCHNEVRPNTDADTSSSEKVFLQSAVLKRLLHELPETLVTNAIYQVLQDPKRPPTEEELLKLVTEMPRPNHEILEKLCRLMAAVAANSEETKMDVENVCVCVMPSLCRKDRSLLEHLTVNLSSLLGLFQDVLGVRVSRGSEGGVPPTPELHHNPLDPAMPMGGILASPEGSPLMTKALLPPKVKSRKSSTKTRKSHSGFVLPPKKTLHDLELASDGGNNGPVPLVNEPPEGD